MKGVQCYELFGGIALKNLTFSMIDCNCNSYIAFMLCFFHNIYVMYYIYDIYIIYYIVKVHNCNLLFVQFVLENSA